MTNTTNKTKTIVYDTKDIQRIFHCGVNQASEMMNAEWFPSFHMNSKAYIAQSVLDEWLHKSKGAHLDL